MQRLRFYVGENKHVRIRIHARNNEPFVIREATWELKSNYEIEARGECIINDDVIDAQIAPQKRPHTDCTLPIRWPMRFLWSV